MKEKYRMQAAFLGAAAASTQYHPLFACGWWWLRGKHKDHTHSAHILLFSSWVQMDEQPYIVCCIVIPVTLFIYDPNQQHDLSNVLNYSFSVGILVAWKVFFFTYTNTESSVSKRNKYFDLNWTKITGIKPSRVQSKLYKLVFVSQKVLFLIEIKLKWFISSIKTFLDGSHLQTIYMIGDILCSFCMLQILK